MKSSLLLIMVLSILSLMPLGNTHGAAGTQPSASTQPATEPIEVDLKQMSLFDLDQKNGTLADIPQRFRDLDGKRVIFNAEMWAPKANDHGGVSYFQAVYSKTKWSFRGAPRAQDFWDCTPVPDLKIHFYDSPVRISGILHVSIHKQGDYIKSIYQLDVQSLKPIED